MVMMMSDKNNNKDFLSILMHQVLFYMLLQDR